MLAILAALFVRMLGHDPYSLSFARKGQPVPDFRLQDLHRPGVMLTQGDLPADRRYLINVWGTWCPNCKVEHPALLYLARERKIPVVGLNYRDERAPALGWLRELGDPYVVSLFDPAGQLGMELGVYGAPETYVVDRDGTLLCRHVGVIDRAVWQQLLEPLLREQNPLREEEVDDHCAALGSG